MYQTSFEKYRVSPYPNKHQYMPLNISILCYIALEYTYS
jgi:hypothetical protein